MRRGRRAASLWEEPLASGPADDDLAFTHGDYCLPKIILYSGCPVQTVRVSGFIDLGRAGVADRYTDLALCAGSIGSNLGPERVKPFFEAYRLAEVDRAKTSLIPHCAVSIPPTWQQVVRRDFREGPYGPAEPFNSEALQQVSLFLFGGISYHN